MVNKTVSVATVIDIRQLIRVAVYNNILFLKESIPIGTHLNVASPYQRPLSLWIPREAWTFRMLRMMKMV